VPLSGYDAAYPPATPPITDVVCFYGGGDTPHVWTTAEIAAQPARYRLPIFVRSNPAGANPTADAEAFWSWLRALGCPLGSATVLDLETAINPAYVTAFGNAMHFGGYRVLPYGSTSTLFQNPVLDGYWAAKPGPATIPSNCLGVQYGQGGNGAWDLDLFSAAIPLWDTRPPLPPPPPVIYPGDAMQSNSITVQIAGGHGWSPSPVPAAQVVNCVPLDENPEDVGRYDSLPSFQGLATQAGPNAPNGALVFAGPVDGTFGFVVWSTTPAAADSLGTGGK